MRFHTERITENSRFWDRVNTLAKEAFPPEEYLAPSKLMEMANACRSKGYGSRAIETPKLEYPGKKQVVDFEMPDDTAANSLQRKKRQEFYLRNGYRETGLFLNYLGVDYEVFCMDETFEPETFKELMKTIRVEGFQPRYFCR